MAVKYVIDDETMTQIADPLRNLTGRTDELTPAEMVEAGTAANEEVQTQTDLITQIQTALNGKTAGAAPVIQELTVTENGTYEASDGADGYSPVVVNVHTGTTEIWTLTMEDGSTVTKEVVVA